MALADVDQTAGILQVAEAHHTVQLLTLQAKTGGAGTGGQNQAGVVLSPPAGSGNRVLFPVNGGNGISLMQGDVVVLIPVRLLQLQTVFVGIAGQQGRKLDAVVGRACLAIEHHNACKRPMRLSNQFFEQTLGHHAVSADNESLFCLCAHDGDALLVSKTKKAGASDSRRNSMVRRQCQQQ